ncbi:MAG: LysM peptidoglycan-binding domain-containing protein [Bacteroidia bacterium]
MRLISLTITTILCVSLFAQKQTPQEYIDRYKDLAVIEMHRSGVPASITLAQGILESSSGNSRLAKYANNHFGIKCKGGWDGEVIYADDDAPDECFRAYASVLDSYRDHSEFLRTNWRYHPLFELNRTDYKGWSRGLKKAGYATNPKYHTILINLIERYELDRFDTAPIPNTPTTPLAGNMVNNVPVMIAQDGHSVSSIASANELRDRHIRKWNDLPKDGEIKAGDMVYLKPKRRRGSEDKHVVGKGESMHSISQTYGIKLKQLYKKNRMEPGTQPAEGETLNMRKKIDKESSVKLAEVVPDWQEPEEEFVNPHSQIDSSNTDFNNAGPIGVAEIEVPEFHIVTKGDNIYRIAEKYRVFEEDLLVWNPDLNPSALSIGQRIYLSEEAAMNHQDDHLESDRVEPPAEIVEEEELTAVEVDEIAEEISVSGPVHHVVVKGDTVYNICKRYGISADELKSWNGLESNSIQLGQKLRVSK